MDQSITQQWHGAQVHSIAENFKIFIQEAFLVGYFSLFAFVITQITNVWHHCTWQEVTIITQHAKITEHHIKIKIIKMINDTIQQLLELLMRFSWIMLQSIFLFFSPMTRSMRHATHIYNNKFAWGSLQHMIINIQTIWDGTKIRLAWRHWTHERNNGGIHIKEGNFLFPSKWIAAIFVIKGFVPPAIRI